MTQVIINSIKNILAGFKVMGINSMQGIVCALVGDEIAPVFAVLINGPIPSIDGIVATNSDTCIYLTATELNKPTHHSKFIDKYYVDMIIKNIMDKWASVIMYTTNHQLDYAQIDRIRATSTIKTIFIIHRPSFVISVEELSKYIEYSKQSIDIKSSHLVGFVEANGCIHVFLSWDNPEWNKSAVAYIKLHMSLNDLITFSLINAVQAEIADCVPKCIRNYTTFEIELKNYSGLYLMPKSDFNLGPIELDEELYYVNSGADIPKNNQLRCISKIAPDKIIVFVDVDNFTKENITVKLSLDSLLVIKVVKKFGTKVTAWKIYIQKFPYRCRPIYNSTEFLARVENKITYFGSEYGTPHWSHPTLFGILELHFNMD